MAGKLFLIISLLIAGSVTLLFGSSKTSDFVLTLEHSRSGELLLEKEIQEETEIQLSWIHSVEKTPWIEIYHVTEEGGLILTETRFSSYGAGVPHEAASVRQESGMIVYEEINEPFSEINWIHSHSADHSLLINNEHIISAEELPDHEPVRLLIEKR